MDLYIIITNDLALSSNLEIYKTSITGKWSIVKVSADYITDLPKYTLEELQPILQTPEWKPFDV